MNPKQRVLTSIGVAAGLLAGGGAGLILQSTGSVGAAAAVAATAPPTTEGGTGTPAAQPKAGAKLQEVLQPLIDGGTLTQAQVDAVIAKIEAARPAAGERGGRGHGRNNRDRGVRRVEFTKVATLLGVTPAEMRTALADGTTTLAAYAESKGKTAQDVIDVLVADAKTHLDKQVADGSITQAKADTRLTTVTTRITELVNNGRPARADRAPAAPPAADTPAPAPAADTPATTVG